MIIHLLNVRKNVISLLKSIIYKRDFPYDFDIQYKSVFNAIMNSILKLLTIAKTCTNICFLQNIVLLIKVSMRLDNFKTHDVI